MEWTPLGGVQAVNGAETDEERRRRMQASPMGTGMTGFQQPQAMAPQPTQQTQQQTQQTQQQAPAQTRTFAQMQQQGQARPAPPPQAPPTQQYQQSQVGQQAVGMLQQQAQQLMAQPTRFDTQAFQQMRGAQAANLQAEYQAEQQRLNEDLARRGLSASSIGGGRMGDLAGQQARALATLDANLLSQAAQTQMQDRLAAAGLTQQLAQTAEGQNLAAYQANLAGQGQGFSQQMQSAGMGEQQRQFDLQQALQRQLGMANIRLDQQRLAQQGQQFGQSLEEQRASRLQQGGLSERELALRQTLGLGELTGQVGGQATLGARSLEQQAALTREGRTFEAEQAAAERSFTSGESALERSLRERLQTGQITAQQAQQERDIAARTALQQAQFGQETEQARLQREFAGGESLAERELRQALQTAQFGQETEQARLQREFAGEESAFERQLRQTLQSGQITESQRAQLADIEARKAMQTAQFGQETEQNRLQRQFAGTESAAERGMREALMMRQQGFEGGQAELERALRERLQGQQIGESQADRALRQRLAEAELSGTYGGQETLAGRQFANQQQFQNNQLMVQLAGLMAGGSPELMQQVLGRFGLGGTPQTPITNTAAPAPTAPAVPAEVPGPTPTATPQTTPMAPTITPTGEVAPMGLTPQALAQLSILQQMSFNPLNYGYNPF